MKRMYHRKNHRQKWVKQCVFRSQNEQAAQPVEEEVLGSLGLDGLPLSENHTDTSPIYKQIQMMIISKMMIHSIMTMSMMMTILQHMKAMIIMMRMKMKATVIILYAAKGAEYGMH